MKTFKWTVLVVTGMFCVVGLCSQAWAKAAKVPPGEKLEYEKPGPESRITVKCQGKTATIVGTSGNDTIEGTPGNDVIHGLSGNDTINGRGGNDIICGGNGNDSLLGEGGNDTLRGDAGNDFLYGHAGNDTLYGNAGHVKKPVQPVSEFIK